MLDHSYKMPVHRDHILLYVGLGYEVSILKVGDVTEVSLGVHGFGMFSMVPIREWLAVPSSEWNEGEYERLSNLFGEGDLVADLLEVQCAVTSGVPEALLVSKMLSLAERYVRVLKTEKAVK